MNTIVVMTVAGSQSLLLPPGRRHYSHKTKFYNHLPPRDVRSCEHERLRVRAGDPPATALPPTMRARAYAGVYTVPACAYAARACVCVGINAVSRLCARARARSCQLCVYGAVRRGAACACVVYVRAYVSARVRA